MKKIKGGRKLHRFAMVQDISPYSASNGRDRNWQRLNARAQMKFTADTATFMKFSNINSPLPRSHRWWMVIQWNFRWNFGILFVRFSPYSACQICLFPNHTWNPITSIQGRIYTDSVRTSQGTHCVSLLTRITVVTSEHEMLNPLKLSGYHMTHVLQHNVPPQCIFLFHTVLTINSDYIPKQH